MLLKGSLHNTREHTRKQENATKKPQENCSWIQGPDSPWDYLKCIYLMISKWHYFCPHKRNLKPARRLFYKHISFYKTCSCFLYSTHFCSAEGRTHLFRMRRSFWISDGGLLFMHLFLLFLLFCILIKPLWKWYQRTAGVKKTSKEKNEGQGTVKKGREPAHMEADV